MNLEFLQNLVDREPGIRVIGKAVEMNGAMNHVMGLILSEGRLKLCVLQYDETFAERAEEAEIAALNEYARPPRTNRERMQEDSSLSPAEGLHSFCQTVWIAGRGYSCEGAEQTRCADNQWETLLLLARFLKSGWNPGQLKGVNLDNLWLATIDLAGEFQEMPETGSDPELRFEFDEVYDDMAAEIPLTLSFEDGYTCHFGLEDPATGERHAVSIQKAYLYDVRGEMRKLMEDPASFGDLPPVEHARIRSDLESNLSKICPEGMCFPVVEYECAQHLSIGLSSSAWLDTEPNDNIPGMIFMVQPEQNKGLSGLPLKTAVIMEPFPPDTERIQAEVYKWTRGERRKSVAL